MIRRKAQAMITMPTDPNVREQELAQQFLQQLSSGPAGAAPQAAPMPMPIEEATVIEINEAAPLGSEASEHIAFDEITDAVTILKKGIEALKAHETQEEEEGTTTKADKAEGKAIKKLEKIVEDLESACAELCEAEEKEHKEKEKDAPATGEAIAAAKGGDETKEVEQAFDGILEDLA